MIEFASDKDTAEIRALWDVAFPEEPLFNAWFFANKFKAEQCLVLRQDNIIKSMAQLLPYEIAGFGRVSYIYGAATHPSCRRQGLMAELLKKSFSLDKACGVKASILIPQNKALFDFYGKIGYKTCFYVNSCTVNREEGVEGYSLRTALLEDIPFMNKLYCMTGNYIIVRDYNYWQTQLEMFNSLGGKVYIIMKGALPVGYGFVTDGYVQEGIGQTNRLALLAGVDKYVTTEGSNSTPIGMAYSENPLPKNMYLNLMYN